MDPEISAHWYQKVLGFARVQPEEWKPYPIFMMRDEFGIAIFPASNKSITEMRSVRIDHFAFRVARADLGKAMMHFDDIGENWDEQDHVYFKSVYLSDPDGHVVELTAEIKSLPEF
jgi:catechol-2,3-dioxygenase